ncbi:hypothetical protein [Amycolatopsis sp. lyj-108]|uniref:hypothetical protein n=1 Tax=Amycolatopsis sp. lyj-108 TaxID=2789286 RepID=UPI00397E6DF8
MSAVKAGLFWLIDFGLIVDLLLLVLGVYSALVVFGVYTGTVVRPHVLSSREVRDPAKAFRDETWLSHDDFYETNLLAELREPITVTRPLGKTESVRVVKFQADDPKAAIEAYERLTIR